MATSSECIQQTMAGALRPAPLRRPGRRRAGNSLGALRRQVRSALAGFLEVRPGEAAVTLLAAGNGPVAEQSFDVVLADCELAHEGQAAGVARDLLTSCKPGGRIGIACPVPGSFLAIVLDRAASYTAGERGFKGTRRALNGLFEQEAIAMAAHDFSVTLQFASAEHWLAEWRRSFAPLRQAFERIGPDRRRRLTEDLLHVFAFFALPVAGRLAVRCDCIAFAAHKADQS